MDQPVTHWEPLSPNQHTYNGIWLFSTGILGCLGNSLVVVMFLKFPKLLSPPNLLLLNIAIGDLCLAGGFPITGTSSLAGKWLWGDLGCQLYAFKGFFFLIGNLATHAMIALDRYLVICRPDPGAKLTYHRYFKMIMFIWIWSFFWSVCPLLGWSRFGFEPSVITCTLDWQNNDASYKSYIMVALIFSYMVPFIIMGYCYNQVSKYLHQAKQQGDAQITYDWVKENDSVKMATSLIAAFLLCWSCYAFVTLWVVVREPITVPVILTIIAPLICKAHPVINPIIYFSTNPTLKKGMIATLCCWFQDPPQELLDAPESKRE